MNIQNLCGENKSQVNDDIFDFITDLVTKQSQKKCSTRNKGEEIYDFVVKEQVRAGEA